MKKQKNMIVLAFGMLLIFIVVAVCIFTKSNQLIERGYLAAEGSKAQDFAVFAASEIQLSDAQVTTLKNAPYDEVLKSEANLALRKIVTNKDFTSIVDYAYVMVHLDESEVKYQVSEENQKIFDAPIGTDLDIMWLLDVNASQTQEEQEQAESTEDQRYSYYIEQDDQIFGGHTTYNYNASEWGNHICGYAPLYSTDGTYIGALGVELQTGDFDSYRLSAMWAMGILLIVSSICLLLLFLILYFKYRKIQYDKIYTDSLTKIYNRSYYNNQFIKKLNGEHRKTDCFALMIADIDLFKKVNDTFGHEIGDQVLLEMGEIMLDTFGKAHVCRFGGEEVVVGIWIDKQEDLAVIIEDLFARIDAHLFSSQQIEVTLSLGCSFCKTPGHLSGWLLSGMLKTADNNLYYVKEHGRHNYRIENYTYVEPTK